MCDIYKGMTSRAMSDDRAEQELESLRSLLYHYSIDRERLANAYGAFLDEARSLGDLFRFVPDRHKRSEETHTRVEAPAV